jgi:hypothetical protein
VIVFSFGDSGPLTFDERGPRDVLGINLPIGLLLQPDPHLALMLQAGYSAVIRISAMTSGNTGTLHFIPVGVEAVVGPTADLDIGLRFFLDGYVGNSGGSVDLRVGYLDLRALMLWFRVHV